MIQRRRPAHLHQQFREIGPLQRDVGRTFIADRANGFQVRCVVTASEAFVNDVADVQTCFAADIIRMGFARDSTAHLAGETVAIQHECARFFGDGTRERRLRFRGFEQVVAGFQIGAVIVGEDLLTLLGAQLTHAARPLAGAPRD